MLLALTFIAQLFAFVLFGACRHTNYSWPMRPALHQRGRKAIVQDGISRCLDCGCRRLYDIHTGHTGEWMPPERVSA